MSRPSTPQSATAQTYADGSPLAPGDSLAVNPQGGWPGPYFALGDRVILSEPQRLRGEIVAVVPSESSGHLVRVKMDDAMPRPFVTLKADYLEPVGDGAWRLAEGR